MKTQVRIAQPLWGDEHLDYGNEAQVRRHMMDWIVWMMTLGKEGPELRERALDMHPLARARLRSGEMVRDLVRGLLMDPAERRDLAPYKDKLQGWAEDAAIEVHAMFEGWWRDQERQQKQGRSAVRGLRFPGELAHYGPDDYIVILKRPPHAEAHLGESGLARIQRWVSADLDSNRDLDAHELRNRYDRVMDPVRAAELAFAKQHPDENLADWVIDHAPLGREVQAAIEQFVQDYRKRGSFFRRRDDLDKREERRKAALRGARAARPREVPGEANDPDDPAWVNYVKSLEGQITEWAKGQFEYYPRHSGSLTKEGYDDPQKLKEEQRQTETMFSNSKLHFYLEHAYNEFGLPHLWDPPQGEVHRLMQRYVWNAAREVTREWYEEKGWRSVRAPKGAGWGYGSNSDPNMYAWERDGDNFRVGISEIGASALQNWILARRHYFRDKDYNTIHDDLVYAWALGADISRSFERKYPEDVFPKKQLMSFIAQINADLRQIIEMALKRMQTMPDAERSVRAPSDLSTLGGNGDYAIVLGRNSTAQALLTERGMTRIQRYVSNWLEQEPNLSERALYERYAKTMNINQSIVKAWKIQHPDEDQGDWITRLSPLIDDIQREIARAVADHSAHGPYRLREMKMKEGGYGDGRSVGRRVAGDVYTTRNFIFRHSGSPRKPPPLEGSFEHWDVYLNEAGVGVVKSWLMEAMAHDPDRTEDDWLREVGDRDGPWVYRLMTLGNREEAAHPQLDAEHKSVISYRPALKDMVDMVHQAFVEVRRQRLAGRRSVDASDESSIIDWLRAHERPIRSQLRDLFDHHLEVEEGHLPQGFHGGGESCFSLEIIQLEAYAAVHAVSSMGGMVGANQLAEIIFQKRPRMLDARQLMDRWAYEESERACNDYAESHSGRGKLGSRSIKPGPDMYVVRKIDNNKFDVYLSEKGLAFIQERAQEIIKQAGNPTISASYVYNKIANETPYWGDKDTSHISHAVMDQYPDEWNDFADGPDDDEHTIIDWNHAIDDAIETVQRVVQRFHKQQGRSAQSGVRAVSKDQARKLVERALEDTIIPRNGRDNLYEYILNDFKRFGPKAFEVYFNGELTGNHSDYWATTMTTGDPSHMGTKGEAAQAVQESGATYDEVRRWVREMDSELLSVMLPLINKAKKELGLRAVRDINWGPGASKSDAQTLVIQAVEKTWTGGNSGRALEKFIRDHLEVNGLNTWERALSHERVESWAQQAIQYFTGKLQRRMMSVDPWLFTQAAVAIHHSKATPAEVEGWVRGTLGEIIPAMRVITARVKDEYEGRTRSVAGVRGVSKGRAQQVVMGFIDDVMTGGVHGEELFQRVKKIRKEKGPRRNQQEAGSKEERLRSHYHDIARAFTERRHYEGWGVPVDTGAEEDAILAVIDSGASVDEVAGWVAAAMSDVIGVLMQYERRAEDELGYGYRSARSIPVVPPPRGLFNRIGQHVEWYVFGGVGRGDHDLDPTHFGRAKHLWKDLTAEQIYQEIVGNLTVPADWPPANYMTHEDMAWMRDEKHWPQVERFVHSAVAEVWQMIAKQLGRPQVDRSVRATYPDPLLEAPHPDDMLAAVRKAEAQIRREMLKIANAWFDNVWEQSPSITDHYRSEIVDTCLPDDVVTYMPGEIAVRFHRKIPELNWFPSRTENWPDTHLLLQRWAHDAVTEVCRKRRNELPDRIRTAGQRIYDQHGWIEWKRVGNEWHPRLGDEARYKIAQFVHDKLNTTHEPQEGQDDSFAELRDDIYEYWVTQAYRAFDLNIRESDMPDDAPGEYTVLDSEQWNDDLMGAAKLGIMKWRREHGLRVPQVRSLQWDNISAKEGKQLFYQYEVVIRAALRKRLEASWRSWESAFRVRGKLDWYIDQAKKAHSCLTPQTVMAATTDVLDRQGLSRDRFARPEDWDDLFAHDAVPMAQEITEKLCTEWGPPWRDIMKKPERMTRDAGDLSLGEAEDRFDAERARVAAAIEHQLRDHWDALRRLMVAETKDTGHSNSAEFYKARAREADSCFGDYIMKGSWRDALEDLGINHWDFENPRDYDRLLQEKGLPLAYKIAERVCADLGPPWKGLDDETKGIKPRRLAGTRAADKGRAQAAVTEAVEAYMTRGHTGRDLYEYVKDWMEKTGIAYTSEEHPYVNVRPADVEDAYRQFTMSSEPQARKIASFWVKGLMAWSYSGEGDEQQRAMDAIEQSGATEGEVASWISLAAAEVQSVIHTLIERAARELGMQGRGRTAGIRISQGEVASKMRNLLEFLFTRNLAGEALYQYIKRNIQEQPSRYDNWYKPAFMDQWVNAHVTEPVAYYGQAPGDINEWLHDNPDEAKRLTRSIISELLSVVLPLAEKAKRELGLRMVGTRIKTDRAERVISAWMYEHVDEYERPGTDWHVKLAAAAVDEYKDTFVLGFIDTGWTWELAHRIAHNLHRDPYDSRDHYEAWRARTKVRPPFPYPGGDRSAQSGVRSMASAQQWVMQQAEDNIYEGKRGRALEAAIRGKLLYGMVPKRDLGLEAGMAREFASALMTFRSRPPELDEVGVGKVADWVTLAYSEILPHYNALVDKVRKDMAEGRSVRAADSPTQEVGTYGIYRLADTHAGGETWDVFLTERGAAKALDGIRTILSLHPDLTGQALLDEVESEFWADGIGIRSLLIAEQRDLVKAAARGVRRIARYDNVIESIRRLTRQAWNERQRGGRSVRAGEPRRYQEFPQYEDEALAKTRRLEGRIKDWLHKDLTRIIGEMNRWAKMHDSWQELYDSLKTDSCIHDIAIQGSAYKAQGTFGLKKSGGHTFDDFWDDVNDLVLRWAFEQSRIVCHEHGGQGTGTKRPLPERAVSRFGPPHYGPDDLEAWVKYRIEQFFTFLKHGQDLRETIARMSPSDWAVTSSYTNGERFFQIFSNEGGQGGREEELRQVPSATLRRWITEAIQEVYPTVAQMYRETHGGERSVRTPHPDHENWDKLRRYVFQYTEETFTLGYTGQELRDYVVEDKAYLLQRLRHPGIAQAILVSILNEDDAPLGEVEDAQILQWIRQALAEVGPLIERLAKGQRSVRTPAVEDLLAAKALDPELSLDYPPHDEEAEWLDIAEAEDAALAISAIFRGQVEQVPIEEG